MFVSDTPIPLTTPSFYFEVTLEPSNFDRASKDVPSLSIGLWSAHALASSAHGHQWAMGSYVYNSREGFKGRWVAHRVAGPALFKLRPPCPPFLRTRVVFRVVEVCLVWVGGHVLGVITPPTVLLD